MEAKELRIGNYLREDLERDGLEMIQVESIWWDESSECYYINQDEITAFEPYPLTEEWLRKFGFERKEGWDDMFFWSIEVNNQTFDLEENPKGYEYDMWIIVKYVHQLQNLFSSLTGKELELKKETIPQ